MLSLGLRAFPAFMKRSEKRILTTHVGSLVRPAELRTNHDAETVKRATAEVVKKQADIGIDIVSDGEYGKSSWSAYVLNRISGFEYRPDQLRPVDWLGRDLQRFPDAIVREMPAALTGRPTEACVGPIEYRDHAPIRHAIENFQSALQGVKVEEAFLTAVAPASTAYDGVNEYYGSDKEYIFAIAEALRQEYLEIHQSGLLLQVDDAVLANMYDHLVQQSPERYREWAQLRVDAVNHALRGIPACLAQLRIAKGRNNRCRVLPPIRPRPALSCSAKLCSSTRAFPGSASYRPSREDFHWRRTV